MTEIAFAPPEEREEIARFMQEVFPRARWSLDGWRRLLDARWSPAGNRYAVTVRDGGALVGVLGLVTAERPVPDGTAITSNMTSWYLRKPYRGSGLGRRMIALAASDPKVTVTNFTSARAAIPVVERAGLVVLDRERLIWRARDKAGPRLAVHGDPAASEVTAGLRSQRVLEDHAGLDLMHVAVETPEGICALVLSVKRKHDAYVTYEALHVGDRDLFGRHARAIADALLPATAAVMSVDRRFVPEGTEADAVEEIPVPRFYLPGRLRREDVDLLYSEVALLNMKLD